MTGARAAPGDDLFPALGFFGAERSTAWKGSVARPLTALRLSMDAATPAALSLRGVDLLKDGNSIMLSPDDIRVTHSGPHASHRSRCPKGLLAGRWWHSSHSTQPFWHVEFLQPLEIHEVRVINRPDGKGLGNRDLLVHGCDVGGQWESLRAGRNEQLPRASRAVAKALGLAHPGAPASHALPARKIALAMLAARATNPGVDIDHWDWPALAACLPLEGGVTPLPDEWTLMAALCLWHSRRNERKGHRALSALLPTTARVAALQAHVDRLCAARGWGRYMVTKHGVSPSQLLSRKDAHLQALAEVMGVLEAAGLEPMLGYGTLLGAVREGGFLPHDDDIDVLYRLRGEAPGSAMARVAALFPVGKYEARRVATGTFNMHVHCRAHRTSIDIFPVWDAAGTDVALHMERMKVRQISRGVIEPRGEAILHGRTFAAPAKPDEFLLHRYGPHWRNPDPYHEWPWALSDARSA